MSGSELHKNINTIRSINSVIGKRKYALHCSTDGMVRSSDCRVIKMRRNVVRASTIGEVVRSIGFRVSRLGKYMVHSSTIGEVMYSIQNLLRVSTI